MIRWRKDLKRSNHWAFISMDRLKGWIVEQDPMDFLDVMVYHDRKGWWLNSLIDEVDDGILEDL